LLDHFKLNIEANHATLAGHDFEHELLVASLAGKLGSIDANRGDLLLGWDTDQFPTDLYQATRAMLIVLKQGGIGRGGFNFDAKLRRSSVDSLDLFYAHIGAMDTFARATIIAADMLADGVFADFVKDRYRSYNNGIGELIIAKKVGFRELEAYIMSHGEPKPVSGQQEYMENLFNSYL
jgi:xylose isomerase